MFHNCLEEKPLYCEGHTIAIKMKRIGILLVCMVPFLLGTISIKAQKKPQKKGTIQTNVVDEDEGPLMFKFDPNYLSATAKRREEMDQTRRILDTLDISENKRKKLLKDLYKNGFTKRLSRALITDNKFENAEN